LAAARITFIVAAGCDHRRSATVCEIQKRVPERIEGDFRSRIDGGYLGGHPVDKEHPDTVAQSVPEE
jgi:hypothetical protein